MQNLLASATEAEHRSSREIGQQWLIALAIFVAAFCLYTRHNDFPFYYHPDEPSKVAQIRDGTRNFNHPLLLLTATDAVRWLRGATTDCQQIVEIGRTCSAVFAATAVALFSWLGFNRFGVIGGIAAGVTMLLQRRLYEHAHFMKEDAALLAGIALTFVAIDAFRRQPTSARAMWLGAATALAASGKYIGIIMLPIAIVVLIARLRSSHRMSIAAGFALGFFLLVGAVNYRALFALPDLVGGISGEIAQLDSRADVEGSFSRFTWFRSFLELSYFLLLFFVVHLAFAIRGFRRLPLPDLLLTAFPFVFGIILSFSSKQSGRHVLPETAVAAFLGALGAVRLVQELAARRVPFRALIVALLLGCAVLYDVVRTSVLDRGFQRDYRRELIAWITTNVPPEATVGVEDRVGIPYEKSRRFCDLPPPFPQAVRGSRFVADLGSLDELRANGITHIAVTPPQLEAFVEERVSAARVGDATFQRRREFYRRLFTEGRLVWSRETGNVGVLNPALRLYEMTRPPSSELNVGR